MDGNLSAGNPRWETRPVSGNRAAWSTTVCWLRPSLWVLASWPHFRPALAWPDILAFFGLGALANVCYSAAYLVDIPMQGSVSKSWPCWRWTLFVVGTLFALLLANHWIADEIFPYIPQ